MMNYSLDKEQEKKFILNYEIVDHKIIIYYADGSIDTQPYSIEKQKEILETMKLQVLEAGDFLNEVNKYFKTFSNWLSKEIAIFLLSSALFYVLFAFFNLPLSVILVDTVFFTGTIGITFRLMWDCIEIREDIFKHHSFIYHSKFLNDTIQNHPEIIKELNPKLRDKALTNDLGEISVTINSIDNLRPREFYKFENQIEQVFDDQQKHKSKTLTKYKDHKDRK